MNIYALFSSSIENQYIYKLTNEDKLRWRIVCSLAYFKLKINNNNFFCYKVDYYSWAYPKYIDFKEEHLQGPLVEL